MTNDISLPPCPKCGKVFVNRAKFRRHNCYTAFRTQGGMFSVVRNVLSPRQIRNVVGETNMPNKKFTDAELEHLAMQGGMSDAKLGEALGVVGSTVHLRRIKLEIVASCPVPRQFGIKSLECEADFTDAYRRGLDREKRRYWARLGLGKMTRAGRRPLPRNPLLHPLQPRVGE